MRRFHLGTNQKIWLISTLILLFGILILFDIQIDKHSPRAEETPRKGAVTSSGYNIEPLATPTPSPTPKPTIRPPVGYCLKVPILMYHHVRPITQDDPAGAKALTVEPDIFEKQIQYLIDKKYTFISLVELVNALVEKTALPNKSISLTFDDGYEDIYQYAFPIGKKLDVKLNLMITTGLLSNSGYLNWGQINEMIGSSLVTVYNHSWSHVSLRSASSAKITEEIATADNQIREHAGLVNPIFAYPYGLESNTAIEVLKQFNYQAAVSTLPGINQCDGYIFTLPRTRVGNTPQVDI